MNMLRLYDYFIDTVLNDGLCLLGKLVDITGEYKYMYLASGAIVVTASIWLLIGNAINYRLLEKEKKREEAQQKVQASVPKESEPLHKPTHEDDVTIKMPQAQDVPPSERETNI